MNHRLYKIVKNEKCSYMFGSSKYLPFSLIDNKMANIIKNRQRLVIKNNSMFSDIHKLKYDENVDNVYFEFTTIKCIYDKFGILLEQCAKNNPNSLITENTSTFNGIYKHDKLWEVVSSVCSKYNINEHSISIVSVSKLLIMALSMSSIHTDLILSHVRNGNPINTIDSENNNMYIDEKVFSFFIVLCNTSLSTGKSIKTLLEEIIKNNEDNVENNVDILKLYSLKHFHLELIDPIFLLEHRESTKFAECLYSDGYDVSVFRTNDSRFVHIKEIQ